MDSDAYLRRILPVKAHMWDGTHADAHRVAAWVIENEGYAEVKLTGGSPSLDVRVKGSKMVAVIENMYVIVLDADKEWYVYHKETFGRYYEPVAQPKEDSAPAPLDHGSRA